MSFLMRRTLVGVGLVSLPFVGFAGLKPQAGPTCNDHIQISLPGTCEEVIFPDMILEGDFEGNAFYEVEIFHGINALGDTAHAGMIGLQLLVQVTHLSTGESCTGALSVTDQWAPVFDCPAEVVSLSCGADPDAVPPPLLTDNCDLAIAPVLLGQQEEISGCNAAGGIWKKITRYWGGTDSWGNAAAPCQQEIHLVRGDLEEVVFPPNLDGTDAPPLTCGETETDPAYTGFPVLNGQALIPGNGDLCDFFVSYEDLIFPGCGNTSKVYRTWTVWDACQTSVPGVNPLVRAQLILLEDLTPPQIECPSELIAPLLGLSCDGPALLPALEISDACSGFSVTVETPEGLLEGNGGELEGLTPGIFPMIYTAIDECGNKSQCEVAVQVVDGVAPVAICDELTVISLDADGVAELPASGPDDGSYDGCTEVSFLARRMEEGAEFAPAVPFSCADADAGPVQVEVEVSDLYGNKSYCMVSVTVQDKIAPVLHCPPAVTFTCEQSPTDLDLTGEPQVWDSCGYELGWTDMDTGSNMCGWGTIVRTFQAVDPSGNTVSCQQTISIVADTLFGVEGIEWPEDYTFPDCLGPEELHPDSLPPLNSWPQFADHPCALIAVNYEDTFYDVVAPACFKIVRTWRVIDWCQFDAQNPNAGGYWEHEQVLKVEDNSPPEIFCSFGSFVKIVAPDCFGSVTLPPPTVKDCSPEVSIYVDSPLGEGFGPFPEVPLGNYPVTYTVSDNCGNLASCSFTLQVVDAKKPTPLCDNGLVVQLMQTGMVELPANILDEGSYDNCTAQEDLTFSFSPNPSDTTMLIDCSTPAGLVVQMWVFDASGNSDYCQTLILIQDNMNVCPAAPISIAGEVTTEGGTGMGEVSMQLNGPGDPSTLTLETGQYTFSDLEAGVDYTLLAEKDDDHGNGVTTYDMVLIARHILGVQPLDSPYKIIAADVNRSNSVSTMDLVELRKLVLHLQEDFSNNTAWRFIDADYLFPDPAHPFQEPFPEAIHINNLIPGLLPASFIGVKVGDVNESAEN